MADNHDAELDAYLESIKAQCAKWGVTPTQEWLDNMYAMMKEDRAAAQGIIDKRERQYEAIERADYCASSYDHPPPREHPVDNG